jgi:hypothetical protein
MTVRAGRAARHRLLVLSALALAVGGAASAPDSGSPRTSGERPCRQPAPSSEYWDRVTRALRSGPDLWGNELLAAPEGPTYEGARAFLKPLLLAKGPRGRALTESGVYYVPFAESAGEAGARSVALHVADGSQIVSQRIGGPTLTVGVGEGGRERYGSCLERLATPGLLRGYLPILETGYVDSAGVGYRQQSFAARIPQTAALVSFVRVVADARAAVGAAAQLRFTPSVAGLARAGDRLVGGDGAYLLFSPDGRFDGRSLAYEVQPGSVRTVYVAWLNDPSPADDVAVGKAYEAARRATIDYWDGRLSEGATFVVPERRVVDAERSLLVQDLELTWRYSIGNPYEEFSFPESVDVAEVIASYGYGAGARSILLTSLSRAPAPYPNWKMGEKLLASAAYYRLFADRSYLDEATPVLRGYVAALGRQIDASSRGLLQRERYSSDIPDSVYGVHSQAVAWQGLRAMGQVWATTGRTSLATRCRVLAGRLESGLREAIRASERRLPDGSLFIPVRLLDSEPPHDALTASRSGSYWNLVMPYALASGLFAPGSAEVRGALEYLSHHGSRLLGLVRAAAFALYGNPVFPTSGTDQVYGTNVARFLADDDQADQLVLSLYGDLAAGMTQGTYISGEAASIAPLGDELFRSMYLPPNSASNAAFLETLRLLLVHETRNREGEPSGLELAYSTPRAWLQPGRQILVRRAPTSFGPLSFSLESRRGSIHATLDVPDRRPPALLRLRLRLPRGSRITGVALDRRRFACFDPETETIDLSGRHGRLELEVAYERR